MLLVLLILTNRERRYAMLVSKGQRLWCLIPCACDMSSLSLSLSLTLVPVYSQCVHQYMLVFLILSLFFVDAVTRLDSWTCKISCYIYYAVCCFVRETVRVMLICSPDPL